MLGLDKPPLPGIFQIGTTMTPLSELLQRQAALNQKIAALKREGRLAAISQIHALMAAHSLSVDDLGGNRPQSASAGGGRSGKTVAAKYRDPVTGETWSGRGLTPKWLSARLAQGQAKEDFAV